MRWIALITFLMGGLILYVQAPFCFHYLCSADTVYHAAKILRVQEGEWFTDPFSGTLTLYPPLFHILFGTISNWLHFNAYETIHLAGMVTYVGTYGALFYLFWTIQRDINSVCASLLLFGLIVYAPSTRFMLLQGPGTFSAIFMILGIASILHYWNDQRILLLFSGTFFLAFAVSLWWFNFFAAAGFLVVVAGLWLFWKRGYSHKQSLVIVGGLMLPLLFTAWHLYEIRDVLPAYLKESRTTASVFEAIRECASCYLHKGSGYYLESLPPWRWNETDEVISTSKLLRDVLNFIQYFLVVLPFHILIIGASIYYFFDMRNKMDSQSRFLRMVWLAAFAIFLFSGIVLYVGNGAHLYRVQFFTAILLLGYVVEVVRQSFSISNAKIFTSFLIVVAVLCSFWNLIHNPLTSSSGMKLDPDREEVVALIRSLPKHKDQRIFAMEETLRELTPFVTFISFVGNHNGTYYFQDPVSSKQFHDDYLTIQSLSDASMQALKRNQVQYLVFKKDVKNNAAALNNDSAWRNTEKRLHENEDDVLRYYQDRSNIILQNDAWVVLKMRDEITF